MEGKLLQKEKEKAIAVIELQLHESRKRVHELECIARKVRLDADRRSTQLQTMAEKKIHALLKQITKLRSSVKAEATPRKGGAILLTQGAVFKSLFSVCLFVHP